MKEKLEYSQKDLLDWANYRGLEINWPKIFPVNSVKAMRGCFYFIDHGNLEPYVCLLYTSPSPRDQEASRMPSSA